MAPKAEKDPKKEPKAEKEVAKDDKESKKKDPSKESKEAKAAWPTKPHEAEFKNKAEAKTTEIDAKKKEMDALIAKINKLSVGKEDYDKKRGDLLEVLTRHKNEKNTLMNRKQDIIEKMQQSRKDDRERSKQLGDLKKTLEKKTEEEIDADIGKIEYRISTTTMPLAEEKKLLRDIKALKQQKPQVIRDAKNYERMLASIEQTNAAPEMNFSDQLDELKAAIEAAKAKVGEQQVKLDELKEERAKKMKGVPEEIEKKKKLKAEIDELFAARSEINKEKKVALDNYYNQVRKRQEEQEKVDKARRDLEKVEWEAERAKRELEKPNPFLNEITLLQQTVDWCKATSGNKDEEEQEEKKELNHIQPEGAKILLSKKDRDYEMYFTATRKKNLKKRNNNSKGGQIKHTADTFAVFDKLKVKAPLTADEIPALQEKLEKELAGYEEKAAKWEESRKQKMAEAAAKSEQEAAASGEAKAEEK